MIAMIDSKEAEERPSAPGWSVGGDGGGGIKMRRRTKE